MKTSIHMKYAASKTFDSVPHQRLLGKLEAYGVRGKLLRWIEAFLVGRKQRVVIQGSKSAWAPVTSGIPQGSVLGPTLFTIFVNDMPAQVTNSIKLFADDTKLYSRIPDGHAGLQADIDALQRWSEKWLLPFNISKCKVMHVGSHNPEHTYTLSGTPIEAAAEEKDLGIVIDRQLKFHRQTAAAVSKASQMLAVVRRSFAKIDETSYSTSCPYCTSQWLDRFWSTETRSGDRLVKLTRNNWSACSGARQEW